MSQPGAEVEGFDDVRGATRIDKSEQSSPSKETKVGYAETEHVRGDESPCLRQENTGPCDTTQEGAL